MNIKIVDASKEYNGRIVLSLEELNFKEGFIYALMGLNGSGKSTLLECTSGIESFTKGKVFYDNSTDIELVRENIAVMLQKPYLFNFSVAENIIMGLKFRKFSKRTIDERFDSYRNYFNLEGLLNKNSRELSGGEQAKTALLRTAILETPVTFLDEPTASMDIENTLIAEKLIKNMALNNRSVILVTHDLFQAERVADYVIFLDKGRIIEQGKKNEVFNSPKHKLLKQILKRRSEKDD
jgi:tungstate transport system ATP-binding protein